MCGRVRLSSDYSEIKIRLKFAPDAPAPNFEPDWNKPPTAPMLVAIRALDGKRTPKMMKWGLVPHWAKDDKLQYSTFNARAERREWNILKPAPNDYLQRWPVSKRVNSSKADKDDASLIEPTKLAA